MAAEDLVLVTGGSGFLGAYCVIEALNHGYRVRTTVRALHRAPAVRTMLQNGGISPQQAAAVEVVAADLGDDRGWQAACAECAYVLHVASPLPLAVPRDADELVEPAREGTLRVLRAARAAGSVRRVVLTSSSGAIFYGHPDRGRRPFTEADWTDTSSPSLLPYPKSKTLAERAAWDFIATSGGDAAMDLAVVNPVGIFGPALSADVTASMEVLVRMLRGDLPGCPKLAFGYVDVRDVAALELRAMVDARAGGERFIANGDEGVVRMREMAGRLRELVGERAKRAPTRELPNAVVRLASWFDRSLETVAPNMGVVKVTSNAKAKQVLGWQPRPFDEMLVDAAESVFKVGLVK